MWPLGLNSYLGGSVTCSAGVGEVLQATWQIDGETMETVRDFILGTPKSLLKVTEATKLKEACSSEEKQ